MPASLTLAPRQRVALAKLLLFEDRPEGIPAGRWQELQDAVAVELTEPELAALQLQLGRLPLRSFLTAVQPGEKGAA